jgi:hypothetical protein
MSSIRIVIFIGIVFGIVVIGTLGGLFWLIQPPIIDQSTKSDENIIQIDKTYWVCTSTHVRHHAAIEMGMKIRRQFPAYDSTECDQWSEKFIHPWPECPGSNAWCQASRMKN